MKNIKTRRVFSPEFKKEKVALIEQGKLRVSEVCKVYQVSGSAVRKWLVKYGKLPKTERLVVEKTSEEKKNVELLKKIAELERVIGQQQLQLIYKESVIQCASEYLGDDWDKNLINGLVLDDINQVIAGDITYFILKEETYYIFTLKDMYSKRIVGLYGSDTMLSLNAIKTLGQVVKLRGVKY